VKKGVAVGPRLFCGCDMPPDKPVPRPVAFRRAIVNPAACG
jgi:hypothetical protein